MCGSTDSKVPIACARQYVMDLLYPPLSYQSFSVSRIHVDTLYVGVESLADDWSLSTRRLRIRVYQYGHVYTCCLPNIVTAPVHAFLLVFVRPLLSSSFFLLLLHAACVLLSRSAGNFCVPEETKAHPFRWSERMNFGFFPTRVYTLYFSLPRRLTCSQECSYRSLRSFHLSARMHACVHVVGLQKSEATILVSSSSSLVSKNCTKQHGGTLSLSLMHARQTTPRSLSSHTAEDTYTYE